jgi:hypothetical protein
MKIGILKDSRMPSHVRDTLLSGGNIRTDSFDDFKDLSKAIANDELHAVIMYEPTEEMTKVSIPFAIVSGSSYVQPSKSVAKFPAPGSAGMSAAAVRMLTYGIHEFYGNHLPEANIAALDDDDDDFVPVVPKEKEMTERDKESLRIATATPVYVPNRPDPTRLKKSRGRGKKVALPDGTQIPNGTNMVHINYRGYNAFAKIVDEKIVFDGVEYDSLTACSNEVTVAIAKFGNLDLGEHNGKANQARTTGTRNWFPEDTPENAEMRDKCHPDVRKTVGVKWSSDPIVISPDGPPRRGRPSKPKPAEVAVAPAEIEEATNDTTEEDSSENVAS